jgi:hypothetical protein
MSPTSKCRPRQNVAHGKMSPTSKCRPHQNVAYLT